MFLEYQNEIIALVVILLLLVVYLLIKLKSKNLETKIENQEDFESLQPDPYDVETQNESLQEPEISQEAYLAQKKQQTPQKQKRKSDIQKREIPQHGKITKQDFAEFSGARILVAEDNLINQKVISGLLADSGIKLVMANDGEEVLEILEKDDEFLMILMDVHMPKINGYEATRAIRANPKYAHIVVVALSGDTAANDIRKMSDAGMAEHLAKPLRMGSLYDVLYAYSGSLKETQTASKKSIKFPMTTELNGHKGLEICGGDETFYLEILYEFVHTYEDSAHRLRDLLTTSQEAAADRLLLDILGVSANIGADTLNKIANNLKETLDDTQEKSYFTNLEQYQSHLEILIQDIKEFIKK